MTQAETLGLTIPTHSRIFAGPFAKPNLNDRGRPGPRFFRGKG